MAWVGPRQMPQQKQASAHPALMLVRPGLVNRWALRQRTAVNYGTELDADLEYVCVRGLRHDLGLLLHAVLLSWLPAPKPAQPGRITVGDVAFDNVSMEQALSQISQMLDGQSAQQVSFVNPACVNIAAGHRGYRRLLARAALVLPDGIGIKIAADLLGQPLRQNVNGTDLFPRLCDLLAERGARLYLLGGQAGVPQRVAQVIRAHWPSIRIVGVRNGFFSAAQEGAVAAEVRASGADIVLVARGVPMQDLFIDREAFTSWKNQYSEQTIDNIKSIDSDLMLNVNPKYVLRNHLAQTAIAQAQTGDMTMVHNLLTVLATPFDEHPAHDAWAGLPPDWAASIEISCSS
jgi:N-acetylglucosaminyldiphosphoundecaprenol N-acetyl-beta-D-mannosaminyltransferase